MRLSVRFTNIKMIMIEEGFCKNAWTSDIKRPEATQRHQSKGKSTGFEYLKYFFVTSFFGAFVNLCFFLFAKIPCTYISILVLLHIICNLFRHVPVNKYLIFWCFFKSLFFYFIVGGSFLNFGFCPGARNNQKEETNQCDALNVNFKFELSQDSSYYKSIDYILTCTSIWCLKDNRKKTDPIRFDLLYNF